ncbi:MAG: PhzF family phenazine biosynthesis protein [Bacteroidetes bacterium]|nr:PhzF family phenazine biosynthesis protein [Bacteroidota bacterium]
MIKIFTVDAFTDKPFKGNPAAVCLPDSELSGSVMQDIAFEMNLSETAFVDRKENGFGLRWFTPKAEVELCGHATLASAHVLWQEKLLSPGDEAVFHTLYKGILTAKKSDKGITLDFPSNPPFESDRMEILEKALGVKAVSFSETDDHYLLELNSESELKNLRPDFAILETLPKFGIIITCRSQQDGLDFISRFFAPSKGVKEDPVTGSAHCVLAPYWSEKLGKKDLRAYQASERGGYLSVSVDDDRVMITGNAVTLISGELTL